MSVSDPKVKMPGSSVNPEEEGSTSTEPEFTLQRLNTLIKSQLRLFLLPEQEKEKVAQTLHPPTKIHPLQGHDLEDKSTSAKVKSSRSPPRKSKYDWKFIVEMLIVDTILTCFLPIFFIPVWLLNLFLRFLARAYLWWQTGGRVRLMQGQDAFWASESQFNPCNFTSLYIIEGVPDLEKIRHRLGVSWVERKDLQGRPMFTKLKLKAVQRANFFGWEYHSDFNLTEHVRYLHPENPDKPIGESQLFEEITAIYDQILPSDKPQWEVLLVPNYRYEGGAGSAGRTGSHHYALIFRVHHSIMDGLSAAQGLRLVFADNVVEAGVDPMKPVKATWIQKVMLNIAAVFLVGPYFLRNVYQKRETNPFHGPSLSGPKTLGWSRPIRLSAVKQLKEATNSSITAVFTSCIGGAFKSLAEAKGLPAPEKLTAATCAALIPYPNIKAQNRFCVLFTPIHAQIRDPLERVARSQEPFENRFIGLAEVIMSYWVTWIGGCLPVPILSLLQDGICSGTILLSNLPGPRTTAQIFGGDPIIDVVGWSPIRNKIGIGLCLFGYNGRVRANVVADASVFPDPADVTNFIAAFEGELASLGRNCVGLSESDLFTEENIQPQPRHSTSSTHSHLVAYYKNGGHGKGQGQGHDPNRNLGGSSTSGRHRVRIS